MSTLEREILESMAKDFTLEEQKLVLKHMRTELLWNEVEIRLKEALDLKTRLETVLKEGTR